MIGRLSGKLLVKQPPYLLIDVGGVGYEVEAPMTTIFKLPEVGQSVILLTHLVIREDAHQLYAFISEQDRQLFRALLKVSGVGAKSALAILSSMDADTFSRSILQEDIAMLTTIPGIGKKSAERLVVEMRDRLSKLQLTTGTSIAASGAALNGEAGATQDAIDALVALGYKAQDATKRVKAAASKEPKASSETLIKLALQQAFTA